MRKSIYIICLALSLSGCGIYKNYEPQKTDVSQLIRSDLTADTVSKVTSLNWEAYYSDPLLGSLIKEGLENNSDLVIAKLNIKEATASLGAAKAAFLPTISIGADGSLSSYDGAKTTKTYSIGPDISWEVDIFGKLSNAKKAAVANVEEKTAYAQAIQTQLIATIAEYYYTLEMLDEQINVTKETVNSWQEYVSTQTALYNAGQTDRSNVSQAEASMLSAQTTLESLAQSISKTENSLCALIGRRSGGINRGKFEDIPMPVAFSSGIPIKNLANRPDIRQAEASLKSAFYNTNKAESAFYPSLTLSGSAGWTNNGGVGVTNPGAILLQAAASLTQPILAKGQNKANLEIAKAQQEEAKVSFKQKVLDAGNEVNNALKKYQSSQNMILLEEQQIDKLKQTVNDTEAQMKYGSTNYLQVIVSRQSLLSAQLNVLTDKYNKIESYIILFQALGGGM